mmetsp:Transcript_16261/g.32353  ORF Transcript_16261/g.32353 Transcript_16261/m.32353 type:complete len:658 (+) Transcript_16261:209-2182(+)
MFRKKDSVTKKEYRLLQLLDLDPQIEKSKFDGKSLKELVIEKPSLFKKEYQFKCHARKIYPLVMAYLLDASEDVTSLICKAHPKATKACPLTAIITGETIDVVRETVSENQMLMEETLCGWNVIHLASIFNADFEIFEFLLSVQHPKALKKKDPNDCTPLLLACQYHSSTAVIYLLMKRAEQSVQILNLKGASPLHIACAREDASKELIESLTEAWPYAIITYDNDGNSPLHVACISNAPAEVIKYITEKSPVMLDKTNFRGDLPYFIAKESGNASAEVISFLGVSSFNRKLMEEDDRNVLFKINELIRLICDVHVMKLFYTFVNTCFRLDHIDEAERNHFIKDGLSEVSKTTCCTPSTAVFKVINQKALDENTISILTFHELDREAEITHTANSAFIGDMWSHINRNTARIERLEDAVDNLNDNIKSLHKAVERLRDAMIERIKADKAVFYMKVVFTVCGLGVVADIFKDTCVDFGNLEDLKGSFPENSIIDYGIESGLSLGEDLSPVGNCDMAEMLGEGSKFATSSQILLQNNAAWNSALFSLAFCAGVTNRKHIQALHSTKGFEFDIKQTEVSKFSGRSSSSVNSQGSGAHGRQTLTQRIMAIANEIGFVCPDKASLTEKVKFLEETIIGEKESSPKPLVARVLFLEESVFARG